MRIRGATMADIVEEKIESQFTGSLSKRLFVYMKPYAFQMILSLVLVLLITGFELVRPILIGNAIDEYIEGYGTPYGIVEESDLYFKNTYLTKDLDNADRYAQLVNFEDNYYYFTDLNQQESAMLTEMSDNGIEAVVIDESTIEIHGLKGIRLSSEELSVLRKKDFEGVRNVAILYAGILLLNLICTFIQTWVLRLEWTEYYLYDSTGIV